VLVAEKYAGVVIQGQGVTCQTDEQANAVAASAGVSLVQHENCHVTDAEVIQD